jgi:hypothetical protein
MRKIISEAEILRKQKRNNILISIFLLLMLLGGTLGFAISFVDSENAEEIDNFEGIILNGQKILLQYSKSDVENISVQINKKSSDYYGKTVYVDSENVLSKTEIFKIMSNIAGKVSEACYLECDEDLPEKNCDDEMIIFELSEERKVYQEQNCIFIKGDIKTVDAFLYKLVE